MNKRPTQYVSAAMIGFTIGAAAAAFAGCAKQKNDGYHHTGPNPAHWGAGVSDQNWELRLVSECEGAEASHCPAAYGFTVTSAGQYLIGPGPANETLSGYLRTEQFAGIQEKVKKAQELVAQGATSESCPGAEQPAADESAEAGAPAAAPAPEAGPARLARHLSMDRLPSKDRIELSFAGQQQILARTGDQGLCHLGLDAEAAAELQNAMQELAAEYTALPFPSECAKAAIDLGALLDAVRGCQSDADCSYTTPVYAPIAAGEEAFVVTDDCTALPQLVAANSALLSESKISELLSKRNDARAACGTSLQRLGCQGVAGLQAVNSKPACVAGRCSIGTGASVGFSF